MVQTKCGVVWSCRPSSVLSLRLHKAKIEMEPYKVMNVDAALRDTVWWQC